MAYTEHEAVPSPLEPDISIAPEMSLRQVVTNGGPAMLVLLCGLLFVDTLAASAFAVLGPDIQNTLGASDLVIGTIAALGSIVVLAAAIPFGYYGDRHRRMTILVGCSAVSGFFVLVTGLASSVWMLAVAWTFVGMAKANEQPIHNSLLADGYPPGGRNRIYGLHRASDAAAGVIGPSLAGGIASVAGGSAGWRWAFLVIGTVIGLFAVGGAVSVPEPPRGHAGGTTSSLREGFARLRGIRTFYMLMTALGALGFGFVIMPVYLHLILEEEFGLTAGQRGVVGSIAAIGGIVGAVLSGTVGDRLFRRNPRHSMLLSAAMLLGMGVAYPLAVHMPNAALYTVFAAVGQAMISGAFVPIAGIVAAVTPPRLRSLGFATVGLYLAVIGGLGGAVLLGLISSWIGKPGAITIMLPIAAAVGASIIARGSRTVAADIAAASDG